MILLTACKGGGIFAVVAVSEKINDGALPNGLNPSAVYEIGGASFFASGPRLWTRPDSESPWTTVELPEGFEVVQSSTASDTQLLLALTRRNSTDNALYFYDGKEFTLLGGNIVQAPPGYQTVRLLYTNGKFYVNVLNFNGTFGDGGAEFQKSSMYTVNADSVEKAAADWDANLSNRYVTGAASSGTVTRFTAVAADGKTGVLLDVLDENVEVVDTGVDVGCSAITWLGGTKNAFIMAGNVPDDDGNFPFFTSLDGNEWTPHTSSNQLASFLYLESKEILLAGTQSGGSDAGSGYVEINAEWDVVLPSDFEFASTTNYDSSSLSSASVTAFSFLNPYVYASTRGKGLWRANVENGDWAQE